MINNEIQQQLFAHIKNNLPRHLNLVDQLSDLLNLSADSIYRRVRGEKPVTLLELKVICEKYQISLDSLLQIQTNAVVFKTSDLHHKSFSFTEILVNMEQQLSYMNSFKQTQMWYLCKDMPFWQFYLFDDIGAFKSFFWAKTIHNAPEYANTKFSLSAIDFSEHIRLGKSCVSLYNKFPSVELWNIESINSTLSQIRFYIDSDGFADSKDVLSVIDAFDASIDHLRLQAEKGYKFMPGDTDLSYGASLQFYVNEVVIGSNTIVVELDSNKIAFIPYNVFSFMHTRDINFTTTVFNSMENLRTKSTLISSTGEKERNKFFKQLKIKIAELRALALYQF